MAEAALSALLSVLMKMLAPPLLQKLGSLYSVKKELNKVRSNFTAIQAVLKDAEEQQWTSNTIKDWLDKLKDAAYDVEDILDECTTDGLRRRVEIRNRTKMRKVRNLFTPSNSVAFKLRLRNKLREVVKRLDEIAYERSSYNLRQEDVNRRDETGSTRVPTHSFVHESEVYGRKDDKEKLVQMLINMANEDEEDVSIIPIVGMGGLGKTTLAKLVYNDERVKSYFDQRMWAFVSEKFNIAEIIRAIIASASEERCDLEYMDALQSRLRRTVSGKKYLIVLDDVWNEKQEAWVQLKTLLKVGARGSKIIATTRSKTVASIMGTLPTYHLEGLLEEDCWSLFKQRAFPKRDDETYPSLVGIGKEIVKKCKGVPLAAEVLGGLLHSKRRESEWISLRNNGFMKSNEDQIMSTLRLSYNHLPSQLKQCFTYCSIFPKGHSFDRDKIIKMWIAQCFIQSSGEDNVTEDTGREYFDELCCRSFFQESLDYIPCRADENLFKMHDLIYDLAWSVRGTECLIAKDRRVECVSGKTRHLSADFEKNIWQMDPMSFHGAEKLRTVMLCYFNFGIQRIPDDISSLTCLRVLDLSYNRIKTLPNSIGKLKHLRYLDLSCTDIETLPQSICTLWNLQTLKLIGCSNLQKLPINMWKMISLRHLDIDVSSYHQITEMPSRIGELKDLQTFPLFIVSTDNGIDVLQGLNLRGELNIKSLENVLNPLDAEKAGLRERQNIHSLGLSWGDVNDSKTAENENYDHVIESLQPHSNVLNLSIKNYMGSRFPHWLMHLKVPNLVGVSLINCRRCKILPPLSQLHHLKFLTIEGMADLEKWSSDETRKTLPRIEKLIVKSCPKLSQLPHLPSVKRLELIGCNEKLLMSLVAYPTITQLKIGGFLEMTSLPEGLLKNKTLLTDLGINDCPKLKSLSCDLHNLTTIEILRFDNCGEVECLMEGLHNLPSLRYLFIMKCHRLKSLPNKGLQRLTFLRDLSIDFCGNLRSLGEGLQHLNFLTCLSIDGCPELAALPENLHKLTALKYLSVAELPKLASLFEEIGNLTSLEELHIYMCPCLLSLPESLQKVTTLHVLSINKCPSLERRCAKDKGKDWHKIAHVRVIVINEQCIQEMS